MKVAGLGFRSTATPASLREALLAAGGADGVAALATLRDKAASPAFVSLARDLALPIRAIAAESIRGIATPTRSDRVAATFGTGSVAEAVALAAAGRGARLLAPRAVSRDGQATAAIAEGDGG